MRGGQARLKRAARNCVCNFGIEVVGVKVFTQPLTSLGVLWMSRIGASLIPSFRAGKFRDEHAGL